MNDESGMFNSDIYWSWMMDERCLIPSVYLIEGGIIECQEDFC